MSSTRESQIRLCLSLAVFETYEYSGKKNGKKIMQGNVTDEDRWRPESKKTKFFYTVSSLA